MWVFFVTSDAFIEAFCVLMPKLDDRMSCVVPGLMLLLIEIFEKVLI